MYVRAYGKTVNNCLSNLLKIIFSMNCLFLLGLLEARQCFLNTKNKSMSRLMNNKNDKERNFQTEHNEMHIIYPTRFENDSFSVTIWCNCQCSAEVT